MCYFIRPEELYPNSSVYLVSLDFETILPIMKVYKLIKKNNGAIQKVSLYNFYKQKVVTLDPKKYYIFEIPEKTSSKILDAFGKYLIT